MPTSLADGHLSDGDIVRLLDGEEAAAERAAHLAACEECSGRLRQLERRSARLTRLLVESDWEAPPAQAPDELALRRTGARRAPARPGWLRAAAVVLLLLGVGVVASPLRARIAEWISAGWTRLVSAEESAAPAADAPGSPALGTRVSLVPGETLFLEFAAAQARGMVELLPGDSPAATAEQVGGAPPAEFLLLPSQSTIRVKNRAGSTADYRVVIPPGVRSVQVGIGDGPARVVTPAQLSDGERVELRSGGR